MSPTLSYLEAVRGKLMAEKRRSDIASEITKAVVAWTLNFWHRSKARTVSKFPGYYLPLVLVSPSIPNNIESQMRNIKHSTGLDSIQFCLSECDSFSVPEVYNDIY